MWPSFPKNEYKVFNLEVELDASVGIDQPREVDTTFLFDTAAGTSVVKNSIVVFSNPLFLAPKNH